MELRRMRVGSRAWCMRPIRAGAVSIAVGATLALVAVAASPALVSAQQGPGTSRLVYVHAGSGPSVPVTARAGGWLPRSQLDRATLARFGVTGEAQQQMDGRALYERGCASCHGVDGRGAPPENVAFTIPVPDFTDCSFASREPDPDWMAVIMAGGPVRAFDSTMPAFEEAFSEEQVQQILDHVRTFCTNGSWPRGELNLPRSIYTEKAFPEDEAVLTTSAAVEGPGALETELVYEKRFGARNQLELVIPFAAVEGGPDGGDWQVGPGDLEVGLKRALFASLSAGTIVSLGGDVVLPTGSESKGLGSGTWKFEPYLAWGQILPADAFLHAQALVEVSADEDKAENEAAWRVVLGRTFTSGAWGRAWSPMIEVLGSTELEGGEASWDVVPQMQVSLNTRQHVMLNLGVRLPVTDSELRDSQLVVYLLWDWFDGGFFDGW